MLERPPPRFRRLVSVFAALLLLVGVSSPAWGYVNPDPIKFYERGYNNLTVSPHFGSLFFGFINSETSNPKIGKTIKIKFSREFLNYGKVNMGASVSGESRGIAAGGGFYLPCTGIWTNVNSEVTSNDVNQFGIKMPDIKTNEITIKQTGCFKMPNLSDFYFWFGKGVQGKTFNFCVSEEPLFPQETCRDIKIPFESDPKLELQPLPQTLVYGKENEFEIKAKPLYMNTASNVVIQATKDLGETMTIPTLNRDTVATVGRIKPTL